MKLAVAVLMHEPQIREGFFAPALLGYHMMDVEVLAVFQVLVANRAGALLPQDKLSATMGRHLWFGSSLLPVVL
jgi:hypothetical protein